jgi:hypothetical protein
MSAGGLKERPTYQRASGTRTVEKPPQFSKPPEGRLTGGGDEFDRLVAMLEQIRKTLKNLIDLEPALLPSELRSQFLNSWPFANGSFADAIATLKDEHQRSELQPKLQAAGFTGPMLEMKEKSLNYHLQRIEQNVVLPAKKNKVKKALDTFVKWLKPGFTVMNSVMGSLLTAIPGLDVAKEFKEHVEAGYEVTEKVVEG